MDEKEKEKAISALRLEILDIERKNLRSRALTDSAIVSEISTSIKDKSKYL